MNTLPLTICSVEFKTGFCLALNQELTERLNPGGDIQWVVLDNNSASDEKPPVCVKDRHLLKVSGVPMDFRIPEMGRGSYHHAAALNKSLKFIQTRFVLFLDPDFFIVMQAWIERVLRHMVNNHLGFFGAPYHPKWFGNYRYFPCAYCLFVDLDKVPIAHLDFTPSFNPDTQFEALSRTNTIGRTRAGQLLRPLRRAAGAFRRRMQFLLLRGRPLRMGTSLDTGYQIFQRYGKNGAVHYETVVPVYRIKDEFMGPPHALSSFWKMLEWIFPDRLCYFPKRPGYYSDIGFRERGYPDFSSRHWEEFLWQGDPFGFHMKLYQKRERSELEDALETAKTVLLRDLSGILGEELRVQL